MALAVKASSVTAPRPFLKWVGGKTQLLDQMEPLLPATFRRYFEPFVGGAAVFFDLRSRRAKLPAFLSDVNAELVDCYTAVRDQVEALIGALQKHEYKSEHYYAVRELKPAALELPARAARTIFLNKTGYNGLYRVNRSGQFNVPFGRFTNPAICDAENLRACSRALAGVSIEHADFSHVLEEAKKGDFVYFDPPYVPVSPTSDFTAYIPGGFGEAGQRKLAKVYTKLATRGVHVMLSNSDTPFVRDLYRDFDIRTVFASRSVNSNAARRGKLPEVVVRSFSHEAAMSLVPEEVIRAKVKAELRKRMRGLRKTTPLEACADRSAKIIARLEPFLVSAKTVALFWPIVERHEVDLRALDLSLRARGIEVAYPTIDPDTNVMSFRFVHDLSELEEAGYGFSEPPITAPEAFVLDVIVVPALAVDPQGHRIGYGAGYYDRTLPRYPGAWIAVAFDWQLIAEVPVGEHDVPVHRVVTDQRVLDVT